MTILILAAIVIALVIFLIVTARRARLMLPPSTAYALRRSRRAQRMSLKRVLKGNRVPAALRRYP